MKPLLWLYFFFCLATPCPALAQQIPNFTSVVQGDAVAVRVQQPPIKIAIVYPAIQSSDYWRRSVVSMEKRLQELNIPVELTTYYSRPADGSRTQEKQITQALQNQPDFLLINTDYPRVEDIIGRILHRGSPHVIIQNQTTENKAWLDTPPLLYSGFDHVKGSELIAHYLFDTYGEDAKYAIIYGTRGIVSTLRGQGFMNVRKLHNARLPVAEYYSNVDINKAHDAAYDILDRHPDLDFLFCVTTDTALGAAQAVDELGLTGKIAVNGWGGGEAELIALAEGKLTLTVMRMNDDNGVSVAEAIKYALTSRRDEIPPTFSGGFELITTENRAEINRLKKRAFRYSGY